MTNALNQAVDYVQPTQSAVDSAAFLASKILSRLQLVQLVLRIPLCLLKPLKPMRKTRLAGKVETRGQVGAGNEITPEEVAAADLVFVAADIDVPLDKFQGKLDVSYFDWFSVKENGTGISIRHLKKRKFMKVRCSKIFAKSEESGEKKASINI